MADKLSKQDVAARITGHLQVYAEKIAEVTDDFNEMEREREMPQAGKLAFAHSCMKDVTELTNFLAKILRETMEQGGMDVPVLPDVADEADVIELDAYRSNGGLLN
jgi:hypothetical protein